MMIRLGDGVILDPAAVLVANWDGEHVHVRLKSPDGGEYSFSATAAQWQAFRDALQAATLTSGDWMSPYRCGGGTTTRGGILVGKAPEPDPEPVTLNPPNCEPWMRPPSSVRIEIRDDNLNRGLVTTDEDDPKPAAESWRDRESQL